MKEKKNVTALLGKRKAMAFSCECAGCISMVASVVLTLWIFFFFKYAETNLECRAKIRTRTSCKPLVHLYSLALQ